MVPGLYSCSAPAKILNGISQYVFRKSFLEFGWKARFHYVVAFLLLMEERCILCECKERMERNIKFGQEVGILLHLVQGQIQ